MSHEKIIVTLLAIIIIGLIYEVGKMLGLYMQMKEEARQARIIANTGKRVLKKY